MATTVLVVLIAYGAILFVIGIWGGRESHTVAGYYLADKKLPSWVIAFSSNTTGESAWLLLGLTGMGYLVGIHALWIVLGEVLGVALAWTFVARPFKAYTDRYDAITVPDYLVARFRDKGNTIRWVSTIIILTMVMAYTAAQLTASGKAFSSFLETSYGTGVIIGAAIIFFYTTVGGFKAVAYSDLLQGVLMFFGLLVLPFVGVAAVGGWAEMTANLQSQDPNLLKPMGEFGMSAPGIVSVIGFVGIGLAFLGAPQLLTRFMAARSQGDIVNGGFLAVICIIVFDLGAVFGGMAGRALFPGLLDSETILPVMTTDLFPAVFAGVYLVIVLAAIMSTVDSLLILASSAVTRDVTQQIYRPNMSDRRLSIYGKLTTVVIGLGALVLAYGEVRIIFWFVLFAWSGLASGFAPVVLCSLFWKRTTRQGAIAGMIGGFLTAVLWTVLLKSRFLDLYEMLPGFFVGFALTIAVSLFTQPPEGADREFDEIKALIRN